MASITFGVSVIAVLSKRTTWSDLLCKFNGKSRKVTSYKVILRNMVAFIEPSYFMKTLQLSQ